MATNITWSEIPVSIRGMTDAEIATILSAMTVGPLDVPAVRFWLKNTKPTPLLIKSEMTGVVAGRLKTVIDDAGTPAELRNSLLEFVEHVLDPTSKTIATHLPEWAIKAEMLLQALEAATVITSTEHAEFHNLDGGLRYPNGVTEANVATARAAEQTRLQNQVHLENVNTAWTEHASAVVGALNPNPITDMQAVRDAVQAFLTAIGG